MSLNQADIKQVKELFSMIESTLPIDSIFSDLSTEPENIKQNSVTDDQLLKHAEEYWDVMSKLGLDTKEIASQFKQTEPFTFSAFTKFCEDFITRKNEVN